MQKIYCSKCNCSTPYEDIRPRRCINCDELFAGAVANQIKIEPIPRKRVESRQKPLDEELEEEYNNYEEDNQETQYTRRPKLEFDASSIELSIPQRPTIDGKSLALDKSPKENIIRPKLKKMKKKEIEEDFRNEVTKGGKNNSQEIIGMG